MANSGEYIPVERIPGRDAYIITGPVLQSLIRGDRPPANNDHELAQAIVNVIRLVRNAWK